MKYNEIKVGDTETITKIISESDVSSFVDLTGDDNPLHVDENYAKNTSFKKRVVHGMLVASYISTVIGTKLPGKGALWLSQSLEFLSPVRIGDQITVSVEVIHKSDSQNVITLDVEIRTGENSIVQRGQANVKILETGSKSKGPSLQKSESKELKNSEKVAIVTGSSRGIGRAVAIDLAKSGFNVIVNCKKDVVTAQELVDFINNKGFSAYLVKADVSNEAACSELVSEVIGKFGRIDVLVNNVSGNIVSSELKDLKWEKIIRDMNIQVGSAFHLSRLCSTHMVSNKFGRIINIGSIETEGVPTSGWYSYNISKSALNSLTKSLALELGPNGITVNTVSPGMTNTDLISEIPDKNRIIYKMQTPLRRLTEPNDVANMVSFLVTDSSSYITGENVKVCGGKVMN